METHREREARHGKDYVLAAYLREHDLDADADAEDAERPGPVTGHAPGQPSGRGSEHQQSEDTPRTSRQPSQPGRWVQSLRRLLPTWHNLLSINL